jgi:methylenetetrahydrofolate--tRNA-(uracil-5-)-methyltransferase
MRPVKKTEVHETDRLSELVCSNSLKSEQLNNASGMLKKELEILGSQLLKMANETRVEAGKALAVDRNLFSEKITQKVNKNVNVIRKHISNLEDFDLENEMVIIATGPLTSDELMNSLKNRLKTKELYFFDAVSPIIDANSIDLSKAFLADRYEQKEEDSDVLKEGHYINCPMNREEYERFRETLINAEAIENGEFEKKYLFERCQPIEEIAKSGVDAMRFGPMKPVGLINPSTLEEAYAIVQLRKENKENSMYNIVGFQTRLKWGEQKRVIRMIPGLEAAEILRYGVMHKNTYINSPNLLSHFFESKTSENLFFAGQITGVEGYVESIASGLYVAINIYRKLTGLDPIEFPEESMMGSLFKYCTTAEKLSPMYANFGLLPELKEKTRKKFRRQKKADRGIKAFEEFCNNEQLT